MDPGAVIEAAKAADGLGSAGLIAATAFLVSAVWSLALWRVWTAWRDDDASKDELLSALEKTMREDTATRSQRAQSWVAVASYVETSSKAATEINLRLQMIEHRLSQIEGRLR